MATLENLYELARRARENKNVEDAAKYYEMALLEDPNSWEAQFYSIYYKARQSKIFEIESAASRVKNCLNSVVRLLQENVAEEERFVAVLELSGSALEIAALLHSATHSHYSNIGASIRAEYAQEYERRKLACAELCYELGEVIERYFGQDRKYDKLIVNAWKTGNSYSRVKGEEYEKRLFPYDTDAQEEFYQGLVATLNDGKFKTNKDVAEILQGFMRLGEYKDSKAYVEKCESVIADSDEVDETFVYSMDQNRIYLGHRFVKIKGYESGSVKFEKVKSLTINEGKLGLDIKLFYMEGETEKSLGLLIDEKDKDRALRTYEELKRRIQKANPDVEETQTKGGCYVATCVYGSYDCPEVWTLRRYRDDTLGATWLGRAFIRLYYAVSPVLVKLFGETKWFKRAWKGTLDKLVKDLQNKGVECTPYKDKDWRK